MDIGTILIILSESGKFLSCRFFLGMTLFFFHFGYKIYRQNKMWALMCGLLIRCVMVKHLAPFPMIICNEMTLLFFQVEY